MVINLMYSIILPMIGCFAMAFILLYGVRFSSSQKGIPDDATWKYILSQPLRECPFWVWIVAILVFQAFIVHTIMLWNPLHPRISSISDLIAFIVLLLYIILVVITNDDGKLRKLR